MDCQNLPPRPQYCSYEGAAPPIVEVVRLVETFLDRLCSDCRREFSLTLDEIGLDIAEAQKTLAMIRKLIELGPRLRRTVDDFMHEMEPYR